MIYFLESFGHLADGAVTSTPLRGRWSSVGAGWAAVSPGFNGNTRGKILRCTSGSDPDPSSLVKDVVNNNHVVMGIAFKYDVLPSFGRFISFLTPAHQPLCQIKVNAAGEIILDKTEIGSSGDTTIVATGSDHISAGATHFLEVDITFGNGAAGSALCHLDGAEIFNVAGVDTIESGVAGTTIGFAAIRSVLASGLEIGNVYFGDHSAGKYTSLMGPQRIGAYFPNADTVQEDFTPTPGPDNFDMVNEIGADEDTTFNSSSVSGAQDKFTHEPINDPDAIVNAIQVTARARKTDAGTRLIEPNIDSAGTEPVLVGQSLSVVYRHRQQVFEIDPATAANWTPAGVDAALISYKTT